MESNKLEGTWVPDKVKPPGPPADPAGIWSMWEGSKLQPCFSHCFLGIVCNLIYIISSAIYGAWKDASFQKDAIKLSLVTSVSYSQMNVYYVL